MAPEIVRKDEEEEPLKVHHLSGDPDECHKFEKQNGTFDNLTPIQDQIQLNKNENTIRFVCISDTHSQQNSKEFFDSIPDGDVLIHAGDFTLFSSEKEIIEFNEFLQTVSQRFKHVVVIAGNHEISFDEATWNKGGLLMSMIKIYFLRSPFSNYLNPESSKSLLTNCHYLQDGSLELFGIKIYGSPWQPPHFNLAFNLGRGDKILEKWNQIPKDTDILITHGPPLGIGDLVKGKMHVGCADLLRTVKTRVCPKYHIFGHIHEDRGMWTDGTTTFINASICDRSNKAVHKPIVFDYPTLASERSGAATQR